MGYELIYHKYQFANRETLQMVVKEWVKNAVAASRGNRGPDWGKEMGRPLRRPIHKIDAAFGRRETPNERMRLGDADDAKSVIIIGRGLLEKREQLRPRGTVHQRLGGEGTRVDHAGGNKVH